MVRVKFCGIRTEAEGYYGAGLGVHALGFVFAKSKRRISPELAGEITASIPPFLAKGGVFVDEEHVNVLKIVDYVGLDFVQLHGDEDEEYLEELSRKLPPKTKIIKAFKVKNEESIKEIFLFKGKKYCSGYLLDAYSSVFAGGTGKSFNWEYFRELKLKREESGLEIPLILAGGLSPANIYEALEKTHPYGVDVSSGIEFEEGEAGGENNSGMNNGMYRKGLGHGEKDRKKMKEFMLNVWRWQSKNVSNI